MTAYLLKGGSAGIKGVSPGSATFPTPQITARLASLVDFFFSRTPIFFSLFSQCGAWSQASSRLQDSTESGSRKVAIKLLPKLGRDREVEPASIVFNTVSQLLIYPVIGQFRQLTSTLTLITWVNVCRVRPTWWVRKNKERKKKKKHGECANPPCIWCNFSIYNKESLTFWHEEQFFWKWAG